MTLWAIRRHRSRSAVEPSTQQQSATRVVGWGPIPLPGERKRHERAERAARQLLRLAAEVQQRNLVEDPGSMITVQQLAESYESLPARLHQVAERHPGCKVVRNSLGNLAIVAADGTYIGYIDVLDGKVELILEEPG